jgi:sulfur carrier protein ThiS
MVDVVFAKAFHRHVDCPPEQVAGVTLREVLDSYFELHPSTRGYVVDDAGSVRRHVAVFHNNDLIGDRVGLTDAVHDGDRVHVFQALSGGSA